MSELVATSFGMVCAYRLFWWAVVNSQGTTISANLDWTVNHLRLQVFVGKKGRKWRTCFFFAVESFGNRWICWSIYYHWKSFSQIPFDTRKQGVFKKQDTHTIIFGPFLGGHSSNFRANVFTVVSEFQVSTGDFPKQQSNLDVLELTFGMNQHTQHFLGPGKTAVAVHVHQLETPEKFRYVQLPSPKRGTDFSTFSTQGFCFILKPWTGFVSLKPRLFGRKLR